MHLGARLLVNLHGFLHCGADQLNFFLAPVGAQILHQILAGAYRPVKAALLECLCQDAIQREGESVRSYVLLRVVECDRLRLKLPHLFRHEITDACIAIHIGDHFAKEPHAFEFFGLHRRIDRIGCAIPRQDDRNGASHFKCKQIVEHRLTLMHQITPGCNPKINILFAHRLKTALHALLTNQHHRIHLLFLLYRLI